MRKKIITRKIVAICLIAFICSFYSNILIAQQENRPVSGFTEISYSIPGKLEIYQGKTESLILKGDPSDLEKIKTEVEGSELKIYTKNNTGRLGEVEVIVTVADLKELSVAGSGNVVFKTGLVTSDFEISLSGSGDISCMELSVNSAEVNLAGSGDIRLGGAAKEALEINIAGSGDVKAEELQVSKCEVNISGSGSVNVWVKETLESNIIGSGNVYYKGNPRIDSSVTGSGSTKPLE
jgi:hypothetical protein